MARPTFKSIGVLKALGLGMGMAGVALLGACDPDVPEREQPGYFEAVFNPDLGLVPLPNTVALDEDGTFPEAGTCEAGEGTAQGHFDDYLAGLSGWPDATPITMELSAAPDEASIGDDDIQLWRLGDAGWERVEDIDIDIRDEDEDACTGEVREAHIIEIVPPEPMSTRTPYFAFATKDIQPADGSADSLIAPEAIHIALSDADIVDEDGQAVSDLLSDEDAQALQQIRQVLSPAVEAIESQTDLSAGDLAMLWNWQTWDDTFVVMDPDTGSIPFPNTLVFDDESGTVDVPIPEDADALTESILTALNQRPGFSSTAPGWVPMDGKVQEDTVNSDTFFVATQSNPTPKSEDNYRVSYNEEWDRVLFEPALPFGAGENMVMVMSEDILGENGRPIQAPPLFVFLRNPYPLVDDDGNPTIDALAQVDAAAPGTAQMLEEGRQTLSLLFEIAPVALGLERSQIPVAWAYNVENPTQLAGPLRQGAQTMSEERTAGWVSDGGQDAMEVGDSIAHPNDPDVDVDMSNVAAIHLTGEFDTFAVDLDGDGLAGVGDTVGFSVAVPEQEQAEGSCAPPFDVAISQHGLGADRNIGGVSMANDLAAYPYCMATVAMDLPLHGGRVEESSTLHPVSTPEGSGDGFLSADLGQSLENFAQSMVDLGVLTTAIIGTDGESELEGLFDEWNVDGDELFGEQVAYVGVSLGGIVGLPYVSIEPRIDTVALHGSGGRLAWILEGDEEGPSVIGEELLGELAAGSGLEPGTEDFYEAMVFVQWLADYVDPFAFANQASEVGTQVMMQMSEGDRVVVNRSTQALADALGISLDDTTYSDVPHAFITDVDAADGPHYEAASCARLQVATWLHSGLNDEDGATLDGISAAGCLE